RDHISVVNLSLGTDSVQSYKLSPLNMAVEKAWDSGVAVVVSAGNYGPLAGTITKPADDPLVITAGAVDDLGTVARADDLMVAFAFVDGHGSIDAYAAAHLDQKVVQEQVVADRSKGTGSLTDDNGSTGVGDGSGGWNSGGWNSGGWNSGGWNSGGWNSGGWNS